MILADRLFPGFMKAADEAFNAITAWRLGVYGFPNARIDAREIAFKEGSGPGHRLIELYLFTPDGSGKTFSLESVGMTECLTAISSAIARGSEGRAQPLGRRGRAVRGLPPRRVRQGRCLVRARRGGAEGPLGRGRSAGGHVDMTRSARKYAVRSHSVDEVVVYFSSPYQDGLEDGRGSLPPPMYGPLDWEEADKLAKGLNVVRDVMDT